MRRMFRFRAGRLGPPSPGTVLGMLALMVALGGTAAANLPGNNQVITTDIRNGHVRAPDIGTGQVRAPDIRSNAVGALKIAADAVGSSEIAADAVGSSEIAADAVESSEILNGGVQDAELGTIVVREASTAVPDGGSGRAEASCDAGERLIGGGGATQQSSSDAIFHGSHPSIGGGLNPVNGATFSDWNAKATNLAGNLATVDVKAWAVCLQ